MIIRNLILTVAACFKHKVRQIGFIGYLPGLCMFCRFREFNRLKGSGCLMEEVRG